MGRVSRPVTLNGTVRARANAGRTRTLSGDKPLTCQSRSTRSLSDVPACRGLTNPCGVGGAGDRIVCDFGLGSDGAMNAGRRIRLWSLLAEHAHGGPVTVEHVCTAVLSAAGVDHAALTVTLPASPRETLHATDRIAAELEELTLTLGEGPGVDALSGGPVLAADVSA